ncbi:hypothetical protein BY458DRAFT_528686 [Sporodiniella umbellata]|nr:hypothetical protein BY458DRAFT_528686 [Sporodiniella umbellata]
MKLIYLSIFLVAVITMATASVTRKACHKIRDPHANAVCKSYCGRAGYLLGECGNKGICICESKTHKS